jgi:hypothetical protein
MIWGLALVAAIAGVAVILGMTQRRRSGRHVPFSLLQTLETEPEAHLAAQMLNAAGIAVHIRSLGDRMTREALGTGPILRHAYRYQVWVAAQDESAARQVLGI